MNLKGKTVCLTGTLTGMPRAVATKYLHDMGAIVVGSVSRNVDVLIAGDKAGSKLATASRLAIPVWDEGMFLRAIDNHAINNVVDGITQAMGVSTPVEKPVKVNPEHYGDF